MIAEIVTLVPEEEPVPTRERPAEERLRTLLEEAGVRVLSLRRMIQQGRLLEQVLSQSIKHFNLVLVLDGSGESGEKVLRKALAQVSGKGLVLEDALLMDLRNDYRNKGAALPKDIETRALLPKDAHWIPPCDGVRPGIWMEVQGAYVLFLPDDVREVEQMWAGTLFSWLGKLRGFTQHTRSLKLSFVGRAPAKIASTLSQAGTEAKVACRSEGCFCTAVISLQGKSPEQIDQALAAILTRIEHDLGEEFLGQGEESLEGLVGRLLIEKGCTIAIAESCTGGLITSFLVEVPGISSVLDRGVVTYSNKAKEALLGVPEDVFKTHGAVSRVTARNMASGIRIRAGTEIGLAVTGIAGPGGGTREKPVGTVFIGLSTPQGNEVWEYHFQGDRKEIRLQTAQMALDKVRRHLLGM